MNVCHPRKLKGPCTDHKLVFVAEIKLGFVKESNLVNIKQYSTLPSALLVHSKPIMNSQLKKFLNSDYWFT